MRININKIINLQGDSGGPMMLKNDKDGRKIVVGVVSVGLGCGRPKSVGIYTRISRYIDWIQNHIHAAHTARNIRLNNSV